MQDTVHIRARRKRTFLEWINEERVAGVICTAPFIIGFFMFLIIPMCMSAYYGLCDFNITSDPTFIGFDNFTKMMSDAKFWTSLRVTFYYAFVSVPLRLVFALIVALILVKNTKLTAFYRAAYYLPSIIGGSVAVSILWKQMFAKAGTINMLLQGVGINSNIAWLGSVDLAIWTLILLSVWQFGSSMLIFLSSLKQIPRSLYEAAEVDGANSIQRFFKITLPMLTPTIFFNLVMQMINGFLAFTQCYIITQGKPMNSTLFYTVYMYQQSFEFKHAGYGAAMAWVMLIIIGIFTGILFLTKKFWVYEEG